MRREKRRGTNFGQDNNRTTYHFHYQILFCKHHTVQLMMQEFMS